jgi:ribokinase
MSGRVVVLGSVNVDLTVRTARLPQPGETVLGASPTWTPGGKGANQAVAAARAGGAVVLCAAVGNDAAGGEAVESLAGEGVDVDRVRRVGEATGTAVVLVDDGGENQIVVVPGANLAARADGVDWHPGDVALAVLEVPFEAVEAFLSEASTAGATTVLNAAPASAAAAHLLPLARVVCVNEAELEALGPLPAGRLPGGAAVVTTFGSRGLRVVDEEGAFHVPPHAVAVVDTVGAGDAVCGVLAASLAGGRSLRESAVRANAAGALAVRRAGPRSSPSAAELDEFLEISGKGRVRR